MKDEFKKQYFKELAEFVRAEYKSTTVYPPQKDIFRAFDECPFACSEQFTLSAVEGGRGNKVKVVILGQDPYHGIGQANGLCFAVHHRVATPPSLQNIFKEIAVDLGRVVNVDTDLTRWAKQGVLLLNATLTVRASQPGSHQGKGWEQFTDAAVCALNEGREHIVFMLWGNYAKQKGAHIDRTKHLVLESAHPSPFSAYNGFFGNKHFSKANQYLKEQGEKEIEW